MGSSRPTKSGPRGKEGPDYLVAVLVVVIVVVFFLCFLGLVGFHFGLVAFLVLGGEVGVGLLAVGVEQAPHLAEFLGDVGRRQVRLRLLDLGPLFFRKVHERRRHALRSVRVLLALLLRRRLLLGLGLRQRLVVRVGGRLAFFLRRRLGRGLALLFLLRRRLALLLLLRRLLFLLLVRIVVRIVVVVVLAPRLFVRRGGRGLLFLGHEVVVFFLGVHVFVVCVARTIVVVVVAFVAE
mmetsp:Transcript_29104/g.88953  ORF Transcript_29104/g.88953 Transcript_29104/m.88953 type:complete len:237 (-) Transcript_29104:1558-2268(-)